MFRGNPFLLKVVSPCPFLKNFEYRGGDCNDFLIRSKILRTIFGKRHHKQSAFDNEGRAVGVAVLWGYY